MLTVTEIYLNQIAQGSVSEIDAWSWFDIQSAEVRAETLQVLAAVCQQSHPLPDEVTQAIVRAGLKETFTPCVVLRKAGKTEHALMKIASLPIGESGKSFRLLLSLFVLADTRRRETLCQGGCTHEWHNLRSVV